MKQRIVRSREHASPGGEFVLYWMQQAQRVAFNPALEYAMKQARERNLALIIAFVLSDEIENAQEAHCYFMIQGISDVAKTLRYHRADFRIYAHDPVAVISELGKDASLVVMDHGYLKWQRSMRDKIFDQLPHSSIMEIDTEAVIPIHQVSDKEEYSAATLRRKILKLLPEYLDFAQDELPGFHRADTKLMDEFRFLGDATDLEALWSFCRSRIKLGNQAVTSSVMGGSSAAIARIKDFAKNKLQYYSTLRNHPNLDYQSHMSSYLHFGQISPIQIIKELKGDHDAYSLRTILAQRKSLEGDVLNLADYLEELVVRRELSMNFCSYNDDYDSFSGLPSWAKASLMNHLGDPRDYSYGIEVYQSAETHDPYWNAAQQELMSTGMMHNYMRMYWGKKVLEWSEHPEAAFEMLLHLNNLYATDGRDANSYAGVAWCFGKHDRPWQERKIFGMIRYMNAAGLERKYDMQAYVSKGAGREL